MRSTGSRNGKGISGISRSRHTLLFLSKPAVKGGGSYATLDRLLGEEKMAKRDTYRYKLTRQGKARYYGITDDPERRREEHENEGKQFDSMNIIRPVVTRDSAEK